MAFEVLKESVTLQKDNGFHRTNDEENPLVAHVAITYSKGDIVQDEDVATSIKALYDSGDERIHTLIKKVGETPAKPKKAQPKKAASTKSTTKKTNTEPKAKAEGQ